MKRMIAAAAGAAAALAMTACEVESDPSAEPEPAGESSSSSAPAGEDDASAWADEIEADLLTALGVKQFQQTCPDVSWACPISDVSASEVGTLKVTEQVDELSEAEAERWAVNVLNFVGADHDDLEWVVIQDGTGTVLGQAERSDSPLL